MTDKFPELDADIEVPEGGDFLSREKELLGDEFQTEQDHDILASDEEISEFKKEFPEVEEAEPIPEPEPSEEEYEAPASNTLTQGESQPLKEWKQRRDLEIQERENANAKKKDDIVQKAQQTIDDFYDNYNNKREQHSKDVLKEQEQFLEKRDNFLKRGTLWDRVNELVAEVGEVSEEKDKTRFKSLLGKLKGKENVPGAGGYQ